MKCDVCKENRKKPELHLWKKAGELVWLCIDCLIKEIRK